ncbi:MAG: hypothetical protein WKI04_19110, partial [Ferruginibacter sp.]
MYDRPGNENNQSQDSDKSSDADRTFSPTEEKQIQEKEFIVEPKATDKIEPVSNKGDMLLDATGKPTQIVNSFEHSQHKSYQ